MMPTGCAPIARPRDARALDAPEVIEVETPPDGWRNTPRVSVLVKLPGGFLARYRVVRRRRGPPVIDPPTTRDGAPGLILPDDLTARVEAAVRAAVRAHPEAWAVVSRPAGAPPA